jgi:hypothetical protein
VNLRRCRGKQAKLRDKYGGKNHQRPSCPGGKIFRAEKTLISPTLRYFTTCLRRHYSAGALSETHLFRREGYYATTEGYPPRVSVSTAKHAGFEHRILVITKLGSFKSVVRPNPKVRDYIVTTVSYPWAPVHVGQGRNRKYSA